MLELKFKYTDDIVNELMHIEKYVTNINNLYLPTREKQKLIYQAKLKKTHFSTSIEGNLLSLDQVEKVVKGKQGKRVNAEIEVANYWDALSFLEESKKVNREIDSDFILELQSIIEKNKGFRLPTPPGVLFAVRDSKTGAIEYIPPQASDIEVCMKDLLKWYKDNQSAPVPIKAAVMHYGLATIHPFEDGNGRTSRLLATYILMINDYDLRGFNYFEEYYLNDLDGYYSSLQMDLPAVFYDGRMNPPHLEIWIEYFLRTMSLNGEKVYELALEASKDKEMTTGIANLEKKDMMLLKYMLENNLTEIKPTQLVDLYKVTVRAITKWAKKWVEKGLLVANLKEKNIISYSLSNKYKKLKAQDIGFTD